MRGEKEFSRATKEAGNLKTISQHFHSYLEKGTNT
jgi:hypothetical protein